MASSSVRNPSPKPPDIHTCCVNGGKADKIPGNHPSSENRRNSPPSNSSQILDATAILTPNLSPTYANMVKIPSTARQPLRPRFSPIPLPTRQVGSKEGRPAISFTGAEVNACEKRFEFSLVAKFTVGRPSIGEIQAAFQQFWKLAGRASISPIWDARHILIILDSEADARAALSSPLNKVGHAFFRLFRWRPDYNPKKESKYSTIWVKLPDIPLSIYDSSFIGAIVSTFGYFVDTDERTKACASVQYARACVELDVTAPIPDSVWISLPNDKGYWQAIVIDSNISYCNKCRVHGHSLQNCRKVKTRNVMKQEEAPTSPRGKVTNESDELQKEKEPNRGDSLNVNKEREQHEDATWQKVSYKNRKANRGTYVPKTPHNELNANGKEASTMQPNNVEDESQSITQKELAMVPYTGGGEPDTSKGEVSFSAEVHYDERFQSHIHPSARGHYSNILDKIGTAKEQQSEKTLSYITQRSKKKGSSDKKDLPRDDTLLSEKMEDDLPAGSKHCLTSSYQ